MVNASRFVLYWFERPYRLMLALCFIFFLTTGIALYMVCQHYEAQKARALSSDKITANLLSRFLSEHADASVAILQSYANRPQLVKAVKERDAKRVLSHLVQLKATQKRVGVLFVADIHGVVWVNCPLNRTTLSKSLSYRDWYKGVSKHWRPYISGVYKRRVGAQNLAIAACTPIIEENGSVVGILAASQSLSSLSDVIKQVPFGDHRKVALIDQAGNILYSSKYPYTEEVSAYPNFPRAQEAIANRRGLIEIDDPAQDGRKTYATLTPIGGIGWTAVVERTGKDVLKTEYVHIAVVSTVSLLSFLLLSLALICARKNVMLSETTARLDMEKRLRHDEERFKELFEHISSGVAVYEARNNGEDFILKDLNKGSERIEGLSREEVIGKPVIEIFPGIKDFGLFEVLQRVYKTGKPENHPAARYKDHRISGWRENYVYKLSTGELVAVYDDITERIERERKLLEQRKQLRTFAARFTEIEEHRRQGLSRELHDQVGQSLTALGINLTVLRTLLPKEGYEAIQARISDSLSLVDQTGDRVRNMMAYLRPPVLDDYGLLAALRWHSGLFSTRTGIAVEVQGEELSDRLEAHVENGLFRITQEALTNVAKHAGATHVIVSLEAKGKMLCLSVADDGVGFDLARPERRRDLRGWGLVTMRERAIAVGGNLSVKSSPGKGTQIIVEVPL